MLERVIATAILSVRLSVCLSVRPPRMLVTRTRNPRLSGSLYILHRPIERCFRFIDIKFGSPEFRGLIRRSTYPTIDSEN